MIRQHLGCDLRSSSSRQREQQAAGSQAGPGIVNRGPAERPGVLREMKNHDIVIIHVSCSVPKPLSFLSFQHTFIESLL